MGTHSRGCHLLFLLLTMRATRMSISGSSRVCANAIGDAAPVTAGAAPPAARATEEEKERHAQKRSMGRQGKGRRSGRAAGGGRLAHECKQRASPW